MLVFLFCTARTNTRNPGEIGLRTCEQLLHCFGVQCLGTGNGDAHLSGATDLNQMPASAAWAEPDPAPLPAALGPPADVAGKVAAGQGPGPREQGVDRATLCRVGVTWYSSVVPGGMEITASGLRLDSGLHPVQAG